MYNRLYCCYDHVFVRMYHGDGAAADFPASRRVDRKFLDPETGQSPGTRHLPRQTAGRAKFFLEQPVNRCFSQAPGVLAGRLSVFPRCSAPDAFLPLENANSSRRSRRGSEQCCCGAQRRQARATNRRARYCPAAQPAHTDSRHAAAAAIPCSFPRWCQHALCIRHVRPLQLPGH